MPYIEDAVQKPGPELFKELLRIYPAEVEDYFKNGQWRMDILKSDFILVSAHREEGGAPDPIPLEDVVLPEMPTAVPGLTGGVKSLLTLPGSQAAATAANVAGPVAELRLIALFVAKWKLDPTKTKGIVAKLAANRRRYVIQNFKTENAGEQATTDLEKYIEECEKDGAWDKGENAPGATAAPAAVPGILSAARPVGATGVVPPVRPTLTLPGNALAAAKRPPTLGVTPPNPLDPSKRPRLSVPPTLTLPGQAAPNPAVKAAGMAPRPVLSTPLVAGGWAGAGKAAATGGWAGNNSWGAAAGGKGSWKGW